MSINKIKKLLYVHMMEHCSTTKMGEKTTNTYIMFESQNNDGEWKKPDKKECVLYDSICIKFQKMQTNLQ